MQAGSRIDVDGRKEHPMDFALWKAAKPDEPYWESPWGRGRPGWHIECSAMSLHHLGEQIDIHGGGNDLVFPHHENEIAQSESFTGKTFAKYWMHNGMMQLSGEKMSKSLGNLVTIEDFLKDNEADVLRVMVLNSGYRSPLTYSDEVVEQSRNALERLRSGLRPAFATAEGASKETKESLAAQGAATREGFTAAMDDDFNSAGALGHVFDLVRTINQARDAMANDEEMAESRALLLELTGVFGLKLEKGASKKTSEETQAGPLIDLLMQVREGLREAKQFALADQIRDRLAELGVVIEDGKDGVTSWRWK
jgi:cysteinyl-tRNA synthetase